VDFTSKNNQSYVFTASGELSESTYGTYEEAYADITSHDVWGVVLKHKPYSFKDEKEEETVVYEHLSHMKP
jgi:hypothetical protein